MKVKFILITLLLSVFLCGCGDRLYEMRDDFFEQWEEDEEVVLLTYEYEYDDYNDYGDYSVENNIAPYDNSDSNSYNQNNYYSDFYVENNDVGQNYRNYNSEWQYEIETAEELMESKAIEIVDEDEKRREEEFEKFLESETEELSIIEIESEELGTELETSVGEDADTEVVKNSIRYVSERPLFVLDSDMCSDVDDAFALSLLLGYYRQGLIDLKGISLCSSRVRSVYATSALCYQSKYYDIPIALHVESGIDMHSSYVNEMSNWPHSEDYYGDNLQLYQEIFASNSQKINIVCTGQLVQLDRLLSKVGAQSISDNVDTLYFVGTKYSGDAENNLWYGAEKYKDGVGDISKRVISNWPTRIVFIPADSGGLMQVGQFLNTSDTGRTDILSEAKYNFSNVYGVTAFDPFGVYVAVMDSINKNDESFLSYDKGIMSINQNGSSYWREDTNGRHERVKLLSSNEFYQNQMNLVLAEEFRIRTGKEVKW